MRMTVKEALIDAVFYEMSLYAHALLIGVKLELFSLQDDISNIDFKKLPINEINAAFERNDLKIIFTFLFAIKRPNQREYAMYLAEDEQSAVQLHRRLFREEPLTVYDQSLKRDTSIIGVYEPLRNAKTFWDYKRNVKFPRFVCLMETKKAKNS